MTLFNELNGTDGGVKPVEKKSNLNNVRLFLGARSLHLNCMEIF